MHILITGGAGFIGSNLCEKLLQEKHRIICVDNLLTGCEKNITHLKENRNFTFLNHDVIQPLEIAEKIDAIFHLASPASPNHHSKLSYHTLAMETMLVNTQGTLALLKLAKKHQAKFLFASTSEIYGNPKVHPQKETYNGNVSPVGPRSIYDEAKRFGETLTFHFFRKENVDARIARIFNTYGPHMLVEDKRMIINFIIEAIAGSTITIYGDGRQTRSLCYIDDMTEALSRLMFYSKTAGEVVNIGSNNEHTVLEYAQMVKEIACSKSDIRLTEPLPQDDPEKRRADITKAQHLLDWKPTITLETGLKKTINYFRKIV